MRYPKAQRAVADVLREAIEEAGTTPTQLERTVRESQHRVRRVVRLERELTVAELDVYACALGVRASVLMARIERRLR